MTSLLACTGNPTRAACSVDAGGVDFGLYEPFSTAPLQSTGWIELRCDEVSQYRVSLISASGSVDARALLGSGMALRYQLYLDPAHTLVWGDGSGRSSVLEGHGSGQRHVVYGRIEAGQNVRPGQYSDVVTVLVSF